VLSSSPNTNGSDIFAHLSLPLQPLLLRPAAPSVPRKRVRGEGSLARMPHQLGKRAALALARRLGRPALAVDRGGGDTQGGLPAATLSAHARRSRGYYRLGVLREMLEKAELYHAYVREGVRVRVTQPPSPQRAGGTLASELQLGGTLMDLARA
jgi:hypothetical protein